MLILLLFGNLSLLAACQSSQPHPVAPVEKTTVLLLPLDNRPVNTQHVQLLARLADYELITPPDELLDYYTTPSDCTSLLNWLAENITTVDAAIIATNNLLSGGLIASRHPDSYLQVAERMTQLGSILSDQEEVDVTLISVLPRQLPTQFDNPGWRYRQELARYGQLTDKTSQGRTTPREEAELSVLQDSLPADILEDYLGVYSANREIGAGALQLIATGVVDRLVLTLDDASEFGLANLQRRELLQSATEMGIANNVFALTGADETSMLALARFATLQSGISPSFRLHYEQASDAELIIRFESDPLAQAIMEKIAFVGGSLDDLNPTNHVFVHARSGESQVPRLAEQLRSVHEQGHLTGVLDLALVNQADRPFIRSLIQLAGANTIDSYAGWNTASNSIGSVVAHLTVRSAINPKLSELPVASPDLQEQLAADLEYRFLHLADEASYQSTVRTELGSWMRNNGLAPEPIPASQQTVVNAELTRLMQPLLDEWSTLLQGRYDYRLSASGQASLTVSGWQWQVSLPWPRLFEVQVLPLVRLAP